MQVGIQGYKVGRQMWQQVQPMLYFNLRFTKAG
jgi:hypothetical protein